MQQALKEKDACIKELEKVKSKFDNFFERLEKLSENEKFANRFFKRNDILFLLDMVIGRVTDYDRVVYPFNINVYNLTHGQVACKAEVLVGRREHSVEIVSIDTHDLYQQVSIEGFVLETIERFAKNHGYKRVFAKGEILGDY